MTATDDRAVPADAADTGIPAQAGIPAFAVISGGEVQRALAGREVEITRLMEDTYRLHGEGDTVNPPSYFLRFPTQPSDRIIALPAVVGGPDRVAGVKWISSFPGNIEAGIPRASAVLILNDPDTGYPYACLESSIISATRTAASAALAADWLSRDRVRPRRVGFVGTGLIARYVHTFLAGTGWDFDEIGVYDLTAASSAGFTDYLDRSGTTADVRTHADAKSLINHSDLIVFATVAGTPHVHDPAWFDHHPVVLHVSLRDLAPEVLLSGRNVVDDVEHCLKADTSPHLVEQRTGNRDFLDGTLPDVLAGGLRLPADETIFFSPFGLGVLDLAVGRYVHEAIGGTGDLHVIDDFFHERRRYG